MAKIYSRIYALLKKKLFNKSKLDGNGERVEIYYNNNLNFEAFDIYQKSHYKRYQFAQGKLANNDICGDFACGTGYGSIMLSKKCGIVVGIDRNEKVIHEIRSRYKQYQNVSFLCQDLLNIDFTNYFDCIVSFETIEHFSEENIIELLFLYQKALKPNGKFIFSTPYKQLKSDAAMKLGFHQTFEIDEEKIGNWLTRVNMVPVEFQYQNYETHNLEYQLETKDFIVCTAAFYEKT